MEISDWAVVYLFGVLISLGYAFVEAMSMPATKAKTRRAARVTLLSPVWPVSLVWGLIVIVPALWRMAGWSRK